MPKKTIFTNIFRWAVASLSLLFVLCLQAAGTHAVVQPVSLLISEAQTGSLQDSLEDARGEFVELYNPLDAAIEVNGWQVQFLTKDHDGLSAPTRVLATLAGTVTPKSYTLVSYDGFIVGAQYYFSGGPSSGYLPKSDGTLRLVDQQGSVIDLLGYGAPQNALGTAATAPEPGMSIERCFAIGGGITYSASNSNDFASYDLPTPGGGRQCPPPAAEPEPPTTEPLPEPPAQPDPPAEELPGESSEPTCAGVVISELMPNPEGVDTNAEFIELHNPTDDAIPLQHCSLKTSANTKQFALGDAVLAAGDYKLWHSDETSLTLPNANGGTVWLLTPALELDTTTYPGDLDDNVAWARFEDHWLATYTPTPGAANSLVATKPCPSGQTRSATSGRCAAVATAAALASALTPCNAGQERNPATNRCRSILGAANVLRPCAANQIRNPATNRCKQVAGAVSTLKPCAEGQERNPATNRCRKIATASTQSSVQDVPSTPSNDSSMGWWLAGIGGVGALSYGVYEWRREISQGLSNIKNRLGSTNSD